MESVTVDGSVEVIRIEYLKQTTERVTVYENDAEYDESVSEIR